MRVYSLKRVCDTGRYSECARERDRALKHGLECGVMCEMHRVTVVDLHHRRL